MSRTPTARTPCPRWARSWPRRPPAPASPSGVPILPCTSASQSTSRWLATTPSGGATWRGPSSQRPRRTTPLHSTCCARSLGSVRASAWCCGLTSMTSSASPACKIARRTAASSPVPRHRRGRATAPRGARVATPLAPGRSLQRPCALDAPLRRARRIVPAWRTHMARARRGPSWRINEPARLTTASRATRRSLGTSCAGSRARRG